MTRYAVLIVPDSDRFDAGDGPGVAHIIGGTERGLSRHEAERVQSGALRRVDLSRFSVIVSPVKGSTVPGADEEE